MTEADANAVRAAFTELGIVVANMLIALDVAVRCFSASLSAAACSAVAHPASPVPRQAPVEAVPTVSSQTPGLVTPANSGPPAPMVAPAASLGGGRWTEARKQVLRRDYPAGVGTGTILQRLNALPGPAIPRKMVSVYAITSLNLHRGTAPAPVTAPRVEPQAAVAPPSPAQPAAVARAPRQPSKLETRDGSPSVAAAELRDAARRDRGAPVSWADAMEWARHNKVPLGGSEDVDLRATNAARRAAKLPPFVIVAPRGKPERLPDPRVGAVA